MNKTAMAEELGVGRNLLYRWLEKDSLTNYAKKANYRRTGATANV
jgi:hypothetical protein